MGVGHAAAGKGAHEIKRFWHRRPAVASGRVSELADGRVAWQLKVPGGRGETHRIMEPMEFMARLSALVPPPRFPLVRYHGVFAPNSPWRVAVVPLRSASAVVKACATLAARARDGKDATETPATTTATATTTTTTTARVEATGDDGWMWRPNSAAPPAAVRTPGRMDWATLMHRVWGWDVLGCPRCGGRMQFIAVITQRAVIERVLTHVGLSAARIVAASARHFDDTS